MWNWNVTSSIWQRQFWWRQRFCADLWWIDGCLMIATRIHIQTRTAYVQPTMQPSDVVCSRMSFVRPSVWLSLSLSLCGRVCVCALRHTLMIDGGRWDTCEEFIENNDYRQVRRMWRHAHTPWRHIYSRDVTSHPISHPMCTYYVYTCLTTWTGHGLARVPHT